MTTTTTFAMDAFTAKKFALFTATEGHLQGRPMPPRTRSRVRQEIPTWGFRPPCARAEQQAYDDVLLSPDLQISILETVGLLGIGLGAINTSWSVAVAGRRNTAWKVLTHEPEKSFGGCGAGDGVAALPEGGVCVTDLNKNRLRIFLKDVTAAPRGPGAVRQSTSLFQRDAARPFCYRYYVIRCS